MKEKNTGEIYLNIGAGDRKLPGFINIDVGCDADLQIDVTKGLPWLNNSVSGIYNEHFIEHLSQADGLQFLRECFRILKPGGIVRIAAPDLDFIVDQYVRDIIHPDWIRFGLEWTNNRCERLNIGMRWWGHQWIYNEEELKRLATIAGLKVVGRFTFGQSPNAIFRDIEHRQSSKLIMEFKKEKPILYSDPLASILIPAYNPKYFEISLLSAINQSYDNIEIVVCDDDRSGKIKEIVDRYPDVRIRYIYNEKQLGSLYNYIKCFELAKGEYIKYLNDDDILHQDCVKKLLGCFLNYPNLTLATSYRQPISATGKEIDDFVFTVKPVNKNSIISGISLAKGLLDTKINFIGEPTTVLFRKSDLEEIKPNFTSFISHLEYSLGDVGMWLNLLIKGDAIYLTETLSYFRQHPEQEQKIMLQDPTILGKIIKAWTQARFDWNRLGFDKAFDKSGFLLTKPYPLKDIDCQWNECNFIDRYIAKPESQSLTVSSWRDRHRWSASAVTRLAGQVALSVEAGAGVHLLMVAAAGENNAIADTIDTLAAQGSEGWRLTVFSPDPCPNPLFETVPVLAWVQITAAESLPSELDQAIALSPVDWFMVCASGIRLESPFVSLVLAAARQNPDWRCIYFDEERFNCEGQPIEPRLKPDANLELLRSSAYVGQAVLVHRELCSVLDYRLAALPRAFAFDAALRAVEAGGEAALGHVDELAVALPEMADGTVEDWVPLAKGLLEAHLARLNELAEVRSGMLPDTFFLDYPLTRRPLVSVIVPTKDRLDLLKPCLDSLLEKTEYREFEVLIVDNASTDRATLDYLKTLARQNSRVKVLPYAAPYNFSAINNMAAKAASGEFLVLLNNDTVVIQPNWLDRMLAHGLRESVGIVGCRLLYPNGSVQHAGVILGLSGFADHIGVDLPMEAPGYSGRAQQTQNFSAVTAACMLIRRDLYHELGGMDTEYFPVSYNDVDLCLKVRARGLSVVWTPFATLVHCAGSSRSTNKPQQISSERRSGYELARKWLSWLSDDPAYNRHLSLVARNWSLDSLSVPWNPRFDVLPRVLADPCDTWGIGHYRVRDPLSTLDAAGIAQHALLPNHEQYYHKLLEPIILGRTGADTFLFQNAFHGEYLSGLEIIRKTLPHRRIVFGQDDIPFAVSPRSAAYKRVPKDAKKNLRRTLSFCDRLVVSNPELANAFRSMIKDIRVVPNYLPRWRWEGLASQRRRGSRPRVGWAGGVDHQGDLEFMLPVVETTHKEVDWVFMGMCPDKIRPLIAEFHQGVPFADYPAALANLDLDLAVAPLELNQFNAAKSNLRLLEYGVLGWPVVCTDIEPYRSAPVCRLPNNPRAWIEAIRERVYDLPAAEREGDALQAWVRDYWMLEDHLEEWRQALLEW